MADKKTATIKSSRHLPYEGMIWSLIDHEGDAEAVLKHLLDVLERHVLQTRNKQSGETDLKKENRFRKVQYLSMRRSVLRLLNRLLHNADLSGEVRIGI